MATHTYPTKNSSSSSISSETRTFVSGVGFGVGLSLMAAGAALFVVGRRLKARTCRNESPCRVKCATYCSTCTCARQSNEKPTSTRQSSITFCVLGAKCPLVFEHKDQAGPTSTAPTVAESTIPAPTAPTHETKSERLRLYSSDPSIHQDPTVNYGFISLHKFQMVDESREGVRLL